MLLLTQLSDRDKKEAIRRWSSNKLPEDFIPSASQTKRRVTYRERSYSDQDEDDTDEDYSPEYHAEGGYDTEPIDESEPGEFEAGLGPSGSPFLIAEMRVFAKHIAQTDNWHNLKGQERFGKFQAKVWDLCYSYGPTRAEH